MINARSFEIEQSLRRSLLSLGFEEVRLPSFIRTPSLVAITHRGARALTTPFYYRSCEDFGFSAMLSHWQKNTNLPIMIFQVSQAVDTNKNLHLRVLHFMFLAATKSELGHLLKRMTEELSNLDIALDGGIFSWEARNIGQITLEKLKAEGYIVIDSISGEQIVPK